MSFLNIRKSWLFLLILPSILFVLSCSSETEIVEVEKVITKEVPVEVEKIVEVKTEVIKEVPVEKVVTVEKIKEVPVEKIVQVESVKEIQIPKRVVVVATATPDPNAGKVIASGEVTAAISNVYFMNSSPRYCPACSVQARTGATEFLLTAVRDDAGQIAIAGQLAESWTQSPDGTSWTEFKLKKGVQFHGGYGEMTAKDVAFSWNDANPNIVADSVHDTGGAIGTILNDVEIIDDYTVKFNWKVFNGSTMLYYVTNFVEGIGVLSTAFRDEVGDDGMKEKLIGTGPYEMEKWVQHDGAYLNAVPDHHRKTASVAKINILEVPEAATRKAMLQTGQAHIVGDLPLKDWSPLVASGFAIANEKKLGDSAFTMAGNYWETNNSDGEEFTSSEAGDALYLPVMADKPWIGHPNDAAKYETAKKVRGAMAMAIDRQALVDVITAGLGTISHMPGIQNSDPLFKTEWEIPYDAAAAKALLEEAGYADGFEVEWWGGPSVATQDTVHEAIAAMWLKELNITSTIDQQNYSSFRPTLVNRTNTKLLVSGGDAHVPATWPRDLNASSISRPGGYNRAIENPTIRDTYNLMAEELDEDKLKELVTAYYDYLREELIWVGVYQSPAAALYNPGLVESWEMVPEGKGVLGMMNSLENIKLK